MQILAGALRRNPGPEVAHQIINTGATTMRHLALSNLVDVETCEYPDSQKILIVAGERGERKLRKIFRGTGRSRTARRWPEKPKRYA